MIAQRCFTGVSAKSPLSFRHASHAFAAMIANT
jgi:hypothetical protein